MNIFWLKKWMPRASCICEGICRVGWTKWGQLSGYHWGFYLNSNIWDYPFGPWSHILMVLNGTIIFSTKLIPGPSPDLSAQGLWLESLGTAKFSEFIRWFWCTARVENNWARRRQSIKMCISFNIIRLLLPTMNLFLLSQYKLPALSSFEKG